MKTGRGGERDQGSNFEKSGHDPGRGGMHITKLKTREDGLAPLDETMKPFPFLGSIEVNRRPDRRQS